MAKSESEIIEEKLSKIRTDIIVCVVNVEWSLAKIIASYYKQSKDSVDSDELAADVIQDLGFHMKIKILKRIIKKLPSSFQNPTSLTTDLTEIKKIRDALAHRESLQILFPDVIHADGTIMPRHHISLWKRGREPMEFSVDDLEGVVRKCDQIEIEIENCHNQLLAHFLDSHQPT